MQVQQVTDQDRYDRTEAYARSILNPPAIDFDPSVHVHPPVTARSRTDLHETLPYFRPNRGSASYYDGNTFGFFLLDEPRTRFYMDSEVVISRISAVNSAGDQAFVAMTRTMAAGTSVVLACQNSYRGLPLDMPVDVRNDWSVLDNFRLACCWAEPAGKARNATADIIFMACFLKVNLQDRSWWTPNQILTPHEQGFVRDWTVGWPGGLIGGGEAVCGFCGCRWPRIYRQGWICVNSSCKDGFWKIVDVNGARDMTAQEESDVEFDDEFLMRRWDLGDQFRPMYDLIPFINELWALNGTGLAVNKSRELWEGVVCPDCRSCSPKVWWHKWHCPGRQCQSEWAFDLGYIPPQTVVSRHTAASDGHPVLNYLSPPDIPYEGPLWRQGYRVDKWQLHRGSVLIAITPHRHWNALPAGADQVYNELLHDANLGFLRLQRPKMNSLGEGKQFVCPTGGRSHFFSSNWGAKYDFSDTPTVPLLDGPKSVLSAYNYINSVCGEELQDHYTVPNQLQTLGYWEGMEMDWHYDGEGELGDTIATVSLGCDATFHIKLKEKHFQNADALEPHGEMIQGSKDWQRNAEAKAALLQGQDVDLSQIGNPDDNGTKAQPRNITDMYRKRKKEREIQIPLLHGSVLIMHGKAIQEYYEHKVQVHGKLRFAVTTRTVDPGEHTRIDKEGDNRRPTGQVFYYKGRISHSGWNFARKRKGAAQDDEADEEDDANENYDASSLRDSPAMSGTPQPASGTSRGNQGGAQLGSRPGTTVQGRPAKRQKKTEGARDVSTESSPPRRVDGRLRTPRVPFKQWSQVEVDRLRALRRDGNKWEGIGKLHGYGRSDAACRHRLRMLDDGQLPSKKLARASGSPQRSTTAFTAAEPDGDIEDSPTIDNTGPDLGLGAFNPADYDFSDVGWNPEDIDLSLFDNIDPGLDDNINPDLFRRGSRARRTGERLSRSRTKAKKALGKATPATGKITKLAPALDKTRKATPPSTIPTKSTRGRPRLISSTPATAKSRVTKSASRRAKSTKSTPAKSKSTKTTPPTTRTTRSKRK